MNMLPYSGIPALPKNIEDMHAQLVALGLNDVEALTARIKKCEDWVDAVEETELTGNPVVFQNALAVPAASLEATIEPIQPLHGYDHPWAGGAGKNKLPYFTSSTQGNVVFTVNDDGTVDFSGTPSGQAQIEHTITLSAGTYIISGAPNGSSIGAKDIFVQSNNVTIARAYDGASLETSTFTLSDNDNIRVVLRVTVSSATSQISGKYKPMICLASAQNPLIYEPYTNICPISGRTETSVTTTNEDESESSSVTIQLGQTVYCGKIKSENVNTKLTVTHKKVVMDGETSKKRFDNKGDGSSNNFYFNIDDGYLFDGYTSNNWVTTAAMIQFEMISSHFVSSLEDEIAFKAYIGSSGTALQPRVQFGASSDITTVELANNWLKAQYQAGTPMEFTYPLATPIELTLTPAQLQMLKGYNSVSSDDASSLTVTAYTGGPWEPITRAIKKVTNKTKTTKKRRK